MLAELRMKLDADKTEIGYYQSSNMQGILMERLESDYAEQLHISGLKPYSQYIAGSSQKEWVVNTLTQEAYQKIIKSGIFDPGLVQERGNVREYARPQVYLSESDE